MTQLSQHGSNAAWSNMSQTFLNLTYMKLVELEEKPKVKCKDVLMMIIRE